MGEAGTVQKCVSIRVDQDEFLDNQSRKFKLSKFLQSKLDSYIKMVNENKEFMEKGVSE